MPDSTQSVSVRLTQAQRKAVAEIVPELADRLKLDEKPQRVIQFALHELKGIQRRAAADAPKASTGMKRHSLRHVAEITALAVDRSKGIGSIPVSERVYQFKITLLNIEPLIWRRIQIKNCTLDRLHDHIQTAMGWSNSHLHHFDIDDQLYGDPTLLDQNFLEMNYEDSTVTKLTDFLPKSGKAFRFRYEYDFGDCWQHEILFEGCVRAERGRKYPLCAEGECACPPDDVGGAWGYPEFLQALADPGHVRHQELSDWIGGSFDPEAFDAAKATRKMRRGLPNWRSENWI